jgi:hypothetical protein
MDSLAWRHLDWKTIAFAEVCGKGASVLAVGGPGEIRKGDFRSIIDDPLIGDPRWSGPLLCTRPKGKTAVDIGSRLELFVDDFMVDDASPGVERRLHPPVPREIVFESNKPSHLVYVPRRHRLDPVLCLAEVHHDSRHNSQ